MRQAVRMGLVPKYVEKEQDWEELRRERNQRQATRSKRREGLMKTLIRLIVWLTEYWDHPDCEILCDRELKKDIIEWNEEFQCSDSPWYKWRGQEERTAALAERIHEEFSYILKARTNMFAPLGAEGRVLRARTVGEPAHFSKYDCMKLSLIHI